MGIKWRVFSGADGGNYNQKFWRGIKSAVPGWGSRLKNITAISADVS
jgi:hypothetical protein